MAVDKYKPVADHEGRKATDKSLGAERASTDQSLVELRKKAETQADQAVLTGRTEADDLRVRVRHDFDDSSLTDRATPDVSRKEERLGSDQRLREERLAADEALDGERREMDEVRQRERSLKKTSQNRLFQSEREETDKDLTQERLLTDADVQRAAVFLSEEKGAHTVTKAALTTRDQFLAIVSHDLTNPIKSISMAADLLKDLPFASPSNDSGPRYVEIIKRNATEALRLISDLMDMERIATGCLGLDLEYQDLNDILEHSVETFQLQAAGKSLAILLTASNGPTKAMCDRGRVAQVVANLVSNAIKFTPKGGTITLSAYAELDSVRISVADTGPGIPKDMLETVFERHYQVGKRDRRGLGLGLYISMMIVEAHHGRIWAESEVGHGCTIHLALPITTVAA